VVAVVSVVLRRKKGNDDLWPASSGDGPVPSYREDPVPSSPSDSGKTVSAAQTSPGDATPPDTDLGMQPQQMASTEDKDRNADVPGTATGGTAHAAPDDTLNTMINGPAAAKEGPGGVRPESDATNDNDEAMGPGGTPLADRGQEPGDERS
jgi:hypothetical protein